jgi:phosphoserine phosphatase
MKIIEVECSLRWTVLSFLSNTVEDRVLATRVILVRHGESTFNAQKRVQGHIDESTLTESGRLGAQQVGNALQGLEFAAAYSSPLKRAKETAELAIAHSNAQVSLQVKETLKEINLPLWEGLTFDAVQRDYPEAYRCWRKTPHELKMQLPSGEDFYPVVALYEQAIAFWKEILPLHAGQTILVVAHSGINRSLINASVGLQPEHYQVFDQSNCGISVLNFSGGWGEQVQLESINLTSHLGLPVPQFKSDRGLRLLLVRHGETNWNRDKRFQGQIDVPLNDNGRLQSQQAGAFLKAIPIDYALSSPMLRPKETAEIILQQGHANVAMAFDDNLCEISHGLWEGKLEEEIEQGFPGLLKQWQEAPETVQMPEGENLEQVWQRAIAAWQALLTTYASKHPDQVTTVLVVAHDAINKAILCYLAGCGTEGFWAFKQGNGAVSVIDYQGDATGNPLIRAMNITTHQGGLLDKTAAGAL